MRDRLESPSESGSGDGKEVGLFVMADTTYGSCCVDEVGASHINADCVVHYGHTCLSPWVLFFTLKFLYQALETFWGFSSFILLNLCIMYCAMKMWAAENASGLYVCVCMCFAKLYVQKSSRHDEILKNHINSEPGYNFCHHNDDNCGFKASWNVNSIYIFFC